MPQMNPANWLMLLILFNFFFLAISMKTHFLTSMKSVKGKSYAPTHARGRGQFFYVNI